jgi:phosphonate transport system substrate-binding protein
MTKQYLLTRAALLLALALGLSLAMAGGAGAADRPYTFNVLNQRTIALTAAYWNPIVTYVSRKSGVALELKLAKTPQEGNLVAEKYGYDFLYTNHFFTPERDRLGYKVIARPAGPGIQSQIVVPADSPAHSLQDLDGKEVSYANPDGFTGYWLPADALQRAKVKVRSSFSGTQEASTVQLKVGKVAAAGVNSSVLARYARREGFAYRALWTSPVYQDLCIMASPKVAAADVAAIRSALLGMAADPEGRKVLEAGAVLLKSEGELGFVAAEDRDYDNYRAFFKSTLIKK